MADEVIELPSQSSVEEALLTLLTERGRPISAREAYQELAINFDLTLEQRQRVMDEGSRNHWENRVQWARNELVKRGVLERGRRGLWSLASPRSGEDWSEEEVAKLVADYFDMLRSELEQRPYSKTEHRNRLKDQITRSDGAIERKHMNVSAVLKEYGYPWIRGYKPYANYQKAILPQLIAPYLEREGKSLDQSQTPTIALPTTLDIFVEPPADGVTIPDASDPVARKFDIAKRDAKNRVLGAAGEAFVVALERERLLVAGREDLSNMVDHVSQTRGDGLGYDIASFTTDGLNISIEVKTTRGGVGTPFYLTENERRAAAKLGSSYKLYRVFHFGSEARIFVLPGPLEDSLTLRPTAYRAGVLPRLG